MSSDSFNRSSSTVGDNFNRANGGLGSNYTTGIATAALGSAAPTITNNQVVGNTNNIYQTAFYSGISFASGSQYADVTIAGSSAASGVFLVALNATASQAYYMQYGGAINTWRIARINGSTTTFLPSTQVNGPVLAAGDVVRFEAINISGQGTWLSVYHNGGLIVAGLDTSPITGGAAGFGIFSNTSNFAITNFHAGNSSIGDLGSNWTVVQGSFAINSNTVQCGTGAPTGSLAVALYIANFYPENQSSLVTLSAAPGSTDKIGAVVRGIGTGCQNCAGPFFTGYVGYAGQGAWTIAKLSAGTLSTLASGSQTWSAGDVLELSVSGTTLTLSRNGSPLGSTTDATYAGGQPGFLLQNNGAITKWQDAGIIFQPSTTVTDNFQRVGPGLGVNWTQYFSATVSIISSGIVGTTGTSGSDNAPSYTGTSLPNDQWSQVTVVSGTLGSAGDVGLGSTVRTIADIGNPSDNDAYTYADAPNAGVFLTYVPNSGDLSGLRILFYYADSGANTELGTALGGPSFQTGDVLMTAVIGDAVYGLRNGVMEITGRSTVLSSGSPGLNLFNTYNLNGGNRTFGAFSAGGFISKIIVSVYSVPDCRNYGQFPNNSTNVNGTLTYTVQKYESRVAGAPTDSRATGAPVASGTYPQNSRTPGTFGPGE